MKKRNQIADKYKWNLSDIYNTVDDLKMDIEKLKSFPERLSSFKGLLGNPTQLLEFFLICTKCSEIQEKVEVYISLKLSENLENQEFLEFSDIINTIDKNISIATAFEETELLSYGVDYINKLLEMPEFKNYYLALHNFLRNKDHILSERDEIILSKASKSLGGYSDVYDNIDTLDIKFEDVVDSNGKKFEVNQHNYSELMESKDRVLRKNAYMSMLNGYKSLANTISTNYIGELNTDWFLADMYGFNSTLEMSLFGENIDKQVYTKLLENINNNLNLMHKFYALKQKGLGLKDFYIYDRSVKITKNNKKIDYEKSYDLVISALEILGEDYAEYLRLARDNRWIDVYPTEKKTTGGFCCNMYKPHPYILLNTVNDSSSIYTLAHELGHAMHGYLSAQVQPYEAHDHTIFLAEIASTCNEVLLFKKLYRDAKNDNEKLMYLEKYISNIFATVYIQTMYSEYEYYAHELVEKELPITKELLNAKWKELNKKYYGKNVKLTKEDCGEGWMRIPHFYRAYYVYKYATGMTCAINFASKIFDGDIDTKNKYLNFLKSGSKDYSINILNEAGIDLLSDEPYEVLFKEINWALNEMSNLI